mgnify:CR=1 FL=1
MDIRQLNDALLKGGSRCSGGRVTHVLGMKPVEISFCSKKPPGLMSANSASLYEPLKAIRERERGEGEKCKTQSK